MFHIMARLVSSEHKPSPKQTERYVKIRFSKATKMKSMYIIPFKQSI